ncbi:site-specific integrase [Candidatus Pelagibacter communis]|uniref:Integrase/recombinase xerD-like protein n=1 Tax=Pelagibacter ubique (strain HTCC1062) TaxID=335992 RepID=Q4FLW2_PELUB|nr:site-specific integrase [Candidatus Pelagibacter ubique]AAZ21826.1 Integrase/recombinase xerD-like protein [Candidatus Pelagibacter ubique HTCC1062]
MNEIITDINALKKETLLNLQSSKSINTARAYKSDFTDFSLFCVKNGFKSLPSEPKIVSLYLTYLSTKEVKMSTLKRRLVSIGVIHKLKGHYLDTKHPAIIENIMGIKRRKGSIQKGKKPLLINNLKQIIDVIDQQKKEEIKKIRDRSIILIGFSGGFRRNEIVSLDFDDLDFVSEGLKINIKRSKTDQFGEGFTKALPYFDSSQYCPVVSLRNWLEISRIKSGSVFRRFIKGSKLSENRLTDQTVALLIKEYLSMLGIDTKNYSGHSLRSGFATSAAESGVEERNIMAMTGHKSTEMVRRYIKDANLFRNNALNKIKI